jgi:hypothetical protein
MPTPISLTATSWLPSRFGPFGGVGNRRQDIHCHPNLGYCTQSSVGAPYRLKSPTSNSLGLFHFTKIAFSICLSQNKKHQFALMSFVGSPGNRSRRLKTACPGQRQTCHWTSAGRSAARFQENACLTSARSIPLKIQRKIPHHKGEEFFLAALSIQNSKPLLELLEKLYKFKSSLVLVNNQGDDIPL